MAVSVADVQDAPSPPLDMTSRPEDRFHTVVAGNRVDLLAARYLGQAELWWVLSTTLMLFQRVASRPTFSPILRFVVSARHPACNHEVAGADPAIWPPVAERRSPLLTAERFMD